MFLSKPIHELIIHRLGKKNYRDAWKLAKHRRSQKKKKDKSKSANKSEKEEKKFTIEYTSVVYIGLWYLI